MPGGFCHHIEQVDCENCRPGRILEPSSPRRGVSLDPFDIFGGLKALPSMPTQIPVFIANADLKPLLERIANSLDRIENILANDLKAGEKS